MLFSETAQKREEKVRGKVENEGKSREIGRLSAEKCRNICTNQKKSVLLQRQEENLGYPVNILCECREE